MTKLKAGIIVLIFVAVVAAAAGYKGFQLGSDWKQAQWDKAELKRKNDEAEADTKIIKQKPKVKHENQNRDRVELVRHICARGWVQQPEKCAAYR